MAYRPRRRYNKRKPTARRGLRRGMGRPRRMISNPMPTFTETFALPRDNLNVLAGTGVGKAFKISFHDIPQWPQYMNLYTQYRINWVKVMLLPSFNGQANDVNLAQDSPALGWAGMARIAYSIQDSPGVTDPTTEAEVLSDNGAKVKAFGTKWSCSFKPVPDVAQTTAVGTILTRQARKQWFNFDPVITGNNPDHGAVTTFITVPGVAGTDQINYSYTCYYKVNFTLRDPQ